MRTILTSGYVDPERISEMMAGGVVEIVQKPYPPEQLVTKIRSAITSPERVNGTSLQTLADCKISPLTKKLISNFSSPSSLELSEKLP